MAGVRAMRCVLVIIGVIVMALLRDHIGARAAGASKLSPIVLSKYIHFVSHLSEFEISCDRTYVSATAQYEIMIIFLLYSTWNNGISTGCQHIRCSDVIVQYW